MADLPSGTNNNEAFCRIFIPIVYWHIGNQQDIWIYCDDWLASNLKKIFSGVYTLCLKEEVVVDGPIFHIVCILFIYNRG